MRIEVLPPERWAGSVSGALVERLQQRPRLGLCLATGSTPVPAYALLPAEALSHASVFLLDEYGGLPAGHAARCETMLKTNLLDRVPCRELHTPAVDASDLDEECRRLDQLIAFEGIDLAILGIGRNGHLGMNEPGSTADSPTRKVGLAAATREGARRYGADPPPTWGITIGLKTLLASEEIWLLVTGRRKAEILERALHGRVGPALPASFLQQHRNTVVWADEAAAELL